MESEITTKLNKLIFALRNECKYFIGSTTNIFMTSKRSEEEKICRLRERLNDLRRIKKFHGFGEITPDERKQLSILQKYFEDK